VSGGCRARQRARRIAAWLRSNKCPQNTHQHDAASVDASTSIMATTPARRVASAAVAPDVAGALLVMVGARVTATPAALRLLSPAAWKLLLSTSTKVPPMLEMPPLTVAAVDGDDAETVNATVTAVVSRCRLDGDGASVMLVMRTSAPATPRDEASELTSTALAAGA
jgi:hypothetical protein